MATHELSTAPLSEQISQLHHVAGVLEATLQRANARVKASVGALPDELASPDVAVAAGSLLPVAEVMLRERLQAANAALAEREAEVAALLRVCVQARADAAKEAARALAVQESLTHVRGMMHDDGEGPSRPGDDAQQRRAREYPPPAWRPLMHRRARDLGARTSLSDAGPARSSNVYCCMRADRAAADYSRMHSSSVCVCVCAYVLRALLAAMCVCAVLGASHMTSTSASSQPDLPWSNAASNTSSRARLDACVRVCVCVREGRTDARCSGMTETEAEALEAVQYAAWNTTERATVSEAAGVLGQLHPPCVRVCECACARDRPDDVSGWTLARLCEATAAAVCTWVLLRRVLLEACMSSASLAEESGGGDDPAGSPEAQLLARLRERSDSSTSTSTRMCARLWGCECSRRRAAACVRRNVWLALYLAQQMAALAMRVTLCAAFISVFAQPSADVSMYTLEAGLDATILWIRDAVAGRTDIVADVLALPWGMWSWHTASAVRNWNVLLQGSVATCLMDAW